MIGRELRKLGIIHCDTKLENLMWDKTSRKWLVLIPAPVSRNSIGKVS